MDACAMCGAAHEPAATGEERLAACVRALAARVKALEPQPVMAGPATSVSVVVPLGGSAGGSGGMS